MKRRDFLTRVGLVTVGLGGAWWLRDHVVWPRPDVVFPVSGTTGWLPYAEPRASLPTVMTTIAGIPVRALIDSGAQYSVIDRGLLDALGHEAVGEKARPLQTRFGVPMVAYGVGGRPQLGRGILLDVGVGAVRLNALRVAILELGPLALRDGLSTQLILGQDVLRELVLELDTKRRRLSLTDRTRHTPAASVGPVATRKSGGGLMTEVTVEGTAIPAMIDTGASSPLTLSRGAARDAGLLDGRPQQGRSSLVLGGVMAASVVQARTVTVGDDLFQALEVPIYADIPLPGFPRALVGMEAFSGKRMTLDLSGGRLLVSRTLDLTVGRDR